MEIVTESKAAALSKATVGISGMTCASCVKAIEGSLSKLPSVQPGSVSVNLLVGSATLMALPDLCTEDMIREAIENSGYDVTSFKYAIPLSTNKNTSSSATYKASLNITGMFCASCTSKVENLLKTLPGVIPTTVKVSLATGSASFEYRLQNAQEQSFTTRSISDKIQELGFVADNVKVEKTDDDSGATAVDDPDDEDSALTTTRLDISGMTCSSCVSAIESSLIGLNGIHQVQVNLLAKSGVIVHDANIIGVRDLIQAVEDTGFEVSLAADDATTNRNALQEKIKKEELMLRRRMLWSLAFAVPMFIFSMVIMMMLPSSNPARQALMQNITPGLRIYDLIMFILATPVQFWLALPFYKKAYRALRYTHTANMETLVALGTSVAYFASLGSIIAAMAKGGESEGGHGGGHGSGAGVDFFETAVFLVFFINLGKWLEAMAKGKTAETITKLMDLQPETATLVKPDETTEEIPASLVQVGDILLVNAGGRIPCDGLLWKGNTMVDEAMITGESMPVQKTERKSKVISASINLTSVIQVKATKVGKDTTLSRIIQLVQDAQASPKAPIEALGDKISSVFVPVVITLGLLTFAGWMIAGRLQAFPEHWIPNGVTYQIYATLFAVAVFVIACPCALGLASPAAVMVGTGVAAKHGILVKGGGFALEMAKRLDIVVFDKTGTLTTGKPIMTDSWALDTDKSGFNMIFQILGKVEAGSSHPVALAVAKGAANILHNNGLPATKETTADGEEEENENEQLQKQFNRVKIAHMREVAGRGLAATLSLSETLTLPGYGNFRAVNVIVGNEKWMQENGAHYPVQVHTADRQKELARWQSEGKSVVLCAISPAGGASSPGQSTVDSSCQCELCACIECNCATSPLGQASVPLIVAQVSVADTARPESKDVIAGLRAMGIETWMLTGDHPTTAKAIAGQLGITNVIAGVLPEDKAAKVKQLQQAGRPLNANGLGRLFGRQPAQSIDNRSLESTAGSPALADNSGNRAMRPAIVAMVGDGINDSPALAQSDLGISVGSATDIAIEAAQIVLLRDTLNDLLVMRDLAKTTVRRIQINFGWAFMYNVVMIPIAAGVLVPWNRSAVISPAWAGLAMAASSVSVVLSSLRLRAYKYKPPKH
ncbi:ATPase Cu transporting protein 7A [Actinomortierella ambigua]|nr:ATPase Cu transporting protein 7A [Actinomortierella ambigua]